MSFLANGFIYWKHKQQKRFRRRGLKTTDFSNLPKSYPKRIWIYWAQGEAQMPAVVRKCVESWRCQNPHYRISVLDDEMVRDLVPVVDEVPSTISRTSFSDILRFELLAEYGGLWVDATVYCLRPVDEWLPQHMEVGFFAFSDPAPGRILASWFLAASAHDTLTTEIRDAIRDHWRGRTKVMTYFWLHYLIEWKVRSSLRFKRKWHKIPRVSADLTHMVQAATSGHLDIDEEETDKLVRISPMQKLTWKEESGERAALYLDDLYGARHLAK